MKKTLMVFNSFDQATAYEDEQERNLTPVQRLAFTVELIKKVFKYDPNATKSRKIKLVHYE